MNILIASDTYYPHVNGASYYTQRLAGYMKSAGHRVLVIAPSTRFVSEYSVANGVDIFGVQSLPVFLYKGFRAAVPIRIKREITQVMTDFKPDIVHIQGHFPLSKTVLEVAKEARLPLVGTNHFMPENLMHYFHLPLSLENRAKSWMWKQFRQTFEQLDLVTTPTKSAADLIYQYGFSKEVKAISCGIDLERFHPRHRTDAIRTKYRLPEVPLLFSVGRLDKEKNLDVVLKAIAKLPASLPMHFAITGKGTIKATLEKLAIDLGLQKRVTFLGFVPDEELPLLYATAHAFISAGTAELQSIVTMEAMASGLPVLAVDAVALPELVHHGENGYLFALKDLDTLAQHIQALFLDDGLQERMGRASLELIKKHDIHAVMAQLQNEYLGVLARKKASYEKTPRPTSAALA